jgi:hypothetical protein
MQDATFSAQASTDAKVCSLDLTPLRRARKQPRLPKAGLLNPCDVRACTSICTLPFLFNC